MAPASRTPSGKISPEELERRLGRGPAEPVYLLSGSEALLRDAALRALKAKVVQAEFEPFNYTNADPAGLDALALAQEMRILPMGGGGRLVVVSPAEGLLKEQIKALAEYAADPNPATCLVLAAAEMKESLRKPFPKAVVVDCSSPYEDHLAAHLPVLAKSLGVRIESDAAASLASLCGRDLSRAAAEMEKAAGFAGPGGAITRGMIESLVGGGGAGDLFKITSALVRGDAAAAVHATRRFLEGEERAELRVLYELGMHLRKLLGARAHVARGLRPAEAARAAGVFWKDADAFAASLPAWSEERIAGAYRALLQADRRIKRGIQDPAGALEAYLWRAAASPAHEGRGGAARKIR